MLALLSALRGAGRKQLFASTIFPRQATGSGSHLLRINEFTKVRNMGVPKDFEYFRGPEMRSSTFAVGGHNWRILCYPNGRWHEDHVSLFIEHAGRHASQEIIGDTNTMAKIQFSILDQALEPSYTKTTILQPIHGCLGWEDGFERFITHEDFDKEKHLKDDCLTVLCDLTVVVTGTDEGMQIPPVAPPFDLRGNLAEAIWNKEVPDLRIKVGRETFPAHRWILEARSPVFNADLMPASSIYGYDYDSTAQLLRDRDMDPQVFKALLQFIYTDSPPEDLLEAATTAERLLVAADRYELQKLKLVCEEALCQHIAMGSVSDTLALAERHRCPVLKEACMRFLSSPANLETVMAMDGFEQLKKDCSSALLELVVKKMTRQEQ